ncbi:MAG: adenosine-specific kinase [Spirochaetia bacterium]
MEVKMDAVQLEWPDDCNIIVGQSHFIKTVEDVAEILVTAVPGIKYGLAFCEASGPCLIRTNGNDDELVKAAQECASSVAAGHSFFLIIRNAFPISILNQLKNCQEIVRLFAATANPLQVLVGETDQGRGVIGVVDGYAPKGIETEQDKEDRHKLLRTIGYKF